MQPTSSTAAVPQLDIHKTMQPQPQQIIMSTNKKKKYVHQPPPTQQQNQHQYQLNKPYNPMKILKPPANQQQTQNYANLGNHSLQGMCTGNVAVNNCQINTANATPLFGLNHLGVVSGISTSAIDANHITSSVYGNTSVGSTSCNNATSCNIGGTNNPSHGNGVGLTMGTSSGSFSSYTHDNGIVGINASGVNVGGCNDNRKRELQIKNNNKLLNNNNSFTTANEFIPSSGSNGTSNARPTQQTAPIYRGPPTSATSRGGARHVSMQPMFQPPMHQGVVVPTYSTFGPRQPTYQSAQYPYSQAIQPFYSSYQFYPPLQQPQTHQRGPVGVSPGVGLNVGNTISVQPNPNGPPGATQSQLSITPVLSVPPCSSTVLSVASTGPGQQQVGGMPGMPSIVGVSVPGTIPSSNVQNKVRRRKHALDIIDPDTKRNIFEDIEAKSLNANERDNLDKIISTPTVAEIQTTQTIVLPADGGAVIYNMDMHQMQQQRDLSGGQTPVVSAMSDAPSVEIRPTVQKPRTKKIISITSPKDEVNKSPSSATSAEESSKHVAQPQHTKKDHETSTQPSNIQQLPQLSQVPLESQNQSNQYPHSSIKSTQVETQDSAIRGNVNKAKKKPISKDSRFPNNIHTADNRATANNSSAVHSEQQTDYCNNSISSLGNSPDSDKISNQSVVEKEEYEEPDCAVEKIESSVEIIKVVEKCKTKLETTNVYIDEIVVTESNECDRNKNRIERGTLNNDENVNSANEALPDIKKLKNISVPVADSLVFQPPCDETDRSSVEAENVIEKNNVEKILSPSQKLVESGDKNNSLVSAPSVDNKMEVLQQATKNTPTLKAAPAPTIVSIAPSLINYNEGQWSPQNPTGKKRYNREQLLQLREAKASRIQPEVKNVSILPQPNLMPSFARGNNSKRVQSMVGSIGGNRGGGSDGNNYISKQASMSGVNSRSSTKGMIHVNLSLNQDVKLNETDNAWRPRALVGGKEGQLDPVKQVQREKEELIRCVRGILNKLTPEKFDTLVEEILKLKINTNDKMEDVMVLVFEKAIDEPNFSVSYARLCDRLISEVKDKAMEKETSNLAHFRNALLDKTEREFTQNVSNCAAKEAKLQPILDKIKNCTDPTEKIELQSQLEEEERKIRRRSGGTVRFIGELFKISLLTGKIINHCIEVLLEPKTEDMLECLCKLLTTVGAKFEQTQRPAPKDKVVSEVTYFSLDQVMARMQTIASKTDSVKVSSRVRFMLQDVIDLRKNKWQSSRNEAPKTMDQIEKEAKSEQLSSQYLNYGGMLPGSGGGASSGSANSSSSKRDDRLSNRYDSRSNVGYGGNHSQRSDTGNLRRQQQGTAGGVAGGNGGGNNSGISNFGGSNDDNVWQVQTSKGRSLAVDSNKLEGLNLTQSLDMGSKKMGGVSQFIWQRQSAPTTAPSNSFAVLSTLVDSNKSSSERARGGLRNKGSVERDRYNNDRGIHSRTGSSQGSRESSTSRIHQGGRAMMNASTIQKSASHKNYTQLMTPRNPGKSVAVSSTSANALHPHHRGEQSHPFSQSQQCGGSEFTNNSQFPTVPPPAVFDELSRTEQQLVKSVAFEMVETTANSKTITSAIVPIINRLADNQRCGFLYYILTDYLHLANVNQLYRRYMANIVIYMIKYKFIAVEHFRLAYERFCEVSTDLIYDVPDLWSYVFEFIGPLIQKQILTIRDLWIKQLKENVSNECIENVPKLGQKFLRSLLVCCTREIGPNFTRNMWKKFNMTWTDFMPECEVHNFIQCNKFEYIENEAASPEIVVKENKAKHLVEERVEHLLVEGADPNAIIDYINGNIANVDKKFINSLTTVVSNFAIRFKDGSYKLDTECFQKVCIPVLQRYIDVNADRELECLYAMQLLVHSLEHPWGLLTEIFGELYDSDVITPESFIKWRDSKDQSAGKGVAVKGLGPFFKDWISGETSEENN